MKKIAANGFQTIEANIGKFEYQYLEKYKRVCKINRCCKSFILKVFEVLVTILTPTINHKEIFNIFRKFVNK
jgi:ribosome-binding ATPase YchF (GTP1/OBG family)